MGSYKALFCERGAKSMTAAAAIARLPNSMLGLGTVLAISQLYNNWAMAGLSSAIFIMSVAFAVPVFAKLFDRYGQSAIIRYILPCQIVGLVLFALLLLMRVPIWYIYICAVFVGLAQFSFGALIRTRWTYVLRADTTEDRLTAAFAFEGAVDETIFVVGPIIAAALATSVHPIAPIIFSTLCILFGGTWFMLQRNTEPQVAYLKPVKVETSLPETLDGESSVGLEQVEQSLDSQQVSADSASRALQHATRKSRVSRPIILYPGMPILLISFTIYNIGFSAWDVAATAMTKSMGIESYVGIILAFFAFGSVFGALIYGARQWHSALWTRYVFLIAMLLIGYGTFWLFYHNIILLCILEALAGLFVSPAFATGNLIIKNMVPTQSMTEGLSWLSTASTAGAAFGSSIGGLVLNSWGLHAGIGVPFMATALALPIATLGWALLQIRTQRQMQ